MRDFPTRGELVADAVGVDLLKLLCMLCCKHSIAWVNDWPEAPGRPWLLWLIDKPGGQPGLASQQRGLFQRVFGRFVFQVGIYNLEQLWDTFLFRLSKIKKYHRIPASMANGRLNHHIIILVACSEHSEERLRHASLQIGGYRRSTPSDIVDVGNGHHCERDRTSKGSSQRLRDGAA